MSNSHKHAPSTRTKERELAFQVLYGLTFSDAKDLNTLADAFKFSPANSHNEDETKSFAWKLVRGVWDNEKFLDEDIAHFSHNWRIERMGRLELLLLRMAMYELINMNTPVKAVISEYLSLATHFGADGAKSFINGILDAASKNLNYKFASRIS